MINSDPVSEQFRKYIIKLAITEHITVYVLWGTDKQNEDFDYLLANEDSKILGFKTIDSLLEYVNTKHVPVDEKNTKEWARAYNSNRYYVLYDFPKLKSVLDKQNFSLRKILKEDALDLVSFYNLFSDYAYQTENQDLLLLIRESNLQLFFDFANNTFFWSGGNRMEFIQKNGSEFDEYIFIRNYLELISLFSQKIQMITL